MELRFEYDTLPIVDVTLGVGITTKTFEFKDTEPIGHDNDLLTYSFTAIHRDGQGDVIVVLDKDDGLTLEILSVFTHATIESNRIGTQQILRIAQKDYVFKQADQKKDYVITFYFEAYGGNKLGLTITDRDNRITPS